MSKQLIRPTFDRVLVKRLEAPSEESGIIVPDGAKEPQSEGIIVAVGPKVASRASEEARFAEYLSDGGAAAYYDRLQTFDVGDQVGFGKYAGVEIVVNRSETYVLLKQDEIQHVIVTVDESSAPAAETSTVADNG